MVIRIFLNRLSCVSEYRFERVIRSRLKS